MTVIVIVVGSEIVNSKKRYFVEVSHGGLQITPPNRKNQL